MNSGGAAMDLTGKALIAMPGMGDPRFEGAVVALCAHGPDRTMGLIVNKPLPDLRLADLLRQVNVPPGLDAPDLPVHFGGPVEPGRGFVLHSLDYRSARNTLAVQDRFGMTATLDILKAVAQGAGPQQCLMTLGYAGWAAGQLEAEIAQNAWLTTDLPAEVLFAPDDARKWEAALKVMGISALTLSSSAGHA